MAQWVEHLPLHLLRQNVRKAQQVGIILDLRKRMNTSM